MDRAGKKRLVETLRATFEGAGAVVVAHYQGIAADEATRLRRAMRAAGASFRVTKNSLAKRALEGTPYAHMAELFAGPTAIAWSDDDPVAAAKATVAAARDNPHIVVLGGGLRATALDEAAVRNLASLPSLDELRARLVGVVSAPATRVAGALQAPAGQLARVFKAHADARAEAA